MTNLCLEHIVTSVSIPPGGWAPPVRPAARSSGGQQLAQHVGQDTPGPVVVHLDGRIDAQRHRHLLPGAVGAADHELRIALRRERRIRHHVDRLVAPQSKGLPGVRAPELQRQHAHAHEVGTVDALEAARDHRLDAQQLRALGRPVAAGAGAVLLAGEDHGGRVLRHVLHRRVEDEHLRALVGALVLEDGQPALLPRSVLLRRDHEVLDAHIGERAAHHHVMVAAARAVAVEVLLHHAVLQQPLAGGRGFLDRPRGRDMVGGDRVAEERHDARAPHRGIAALRRLEREVREERRLGDVGARGPVVGVARYTLDLAPEGSRIGLHLAVVIAERLAVHRMLHELVHLVAAGPDIAQVHVAPAAPLAHRLGHQVPQHRAGDGIGHHQGRAREEIGLDVGMDARLKIAVAREHGGADEIAARDRIVDLGREVTRVADAGRAAVARHGEAQLLEIGQQAGFAQVLRDDARSGGQRGLDVRLDLQACLHRLLRQQARREQHARVGGVGAARDGRDQHVAVADRRVGPLGRQADGGVGVLDREPGLVVLHFHEETRPAGGCVLLGGYVLAHVLLAAVDVVARVQQLRRPVEAALRGRPGEQRGELLLHLAQLDAILRPLRAGQAGSDVAQVQAHHLRIIDLAGLRHAEQALGAEIRLESLDLGLGAARALEVVDGLLVHREEAHGGTVLGCHVADGRPVRQRQGARALAEELHELAHHLVAAQDLGHRQHQVGGRHALAQLARQLEAHHVGREEVHRLPEHRRLGLDTADAPGHHADAVDHGRVAVRADQGVGVVNAIGALVHAAREVFQVHLVDDAEARRHHPEGVERLHAPLHEFIALAVALEFELHVQVQGLLRAVVIDHDGVVHHEIDRNQRLDLLGFPSQALRNAAHRGQVGQQGHAGEILQHHARHDEGNLVLPVGNGLPVRELLHMLGRHLQAIAIAEDGLQNDANGHRQALDGRVLPRQGGKGIELAAFTRPGRECLQGGCESVARNHGGLRGHVALLL